MAKAIMIQGTMSGAGKSLVTAGLCRVFRQDGFRVMPFKSQNMALNSFITEEGLEMGRAQVLQAEAAGVKPLVDMNPILLKPTGDTGSQVIVHGEVLGNMSAADYFVFRKNLIPEIRKAYDRLAAQADIIVVEGAGSPAEINLKENDIVNMGLAKLLDAPVLLVGDIDRGGVFAQLYGTVELLSPEEQARVKGLIINKFRGDVTILEPGLRMLEEKTGKPVAGVIPWTRLQLEDEDSLTDRFRQRKAERIDLAVIRFPRISNFTDFDVFENFPGVSLRYVEHAGQLGSPDLIFLPGSKNTMEDLRWFRESGLEAAALKAHEKGTILFGICGGFQMLGREVSDPEGVEAGGRIRGIGLLPVKTVLAGQKVRRQVTGKMLKIQGGLATLSGKPVEGYEIHMGRTVFASAETEPCSVSDRQEQPEPVTVLSARQAADGKTWCDGVQAGNVFGTYVHGIFDAGDTAKTLLKALAARKGLDLEEPGFSDYQKFREEQLDLLADTIRKSLDMKLVYECLGMETI